jgi:hypothetical protein
MGLIVAALVATGSFLGLLHALLSIPQFTCIGTAPNLNVVSPEIDLLIILACLAVAWLLALSQPGVFAFHQAGTHFYGHEKTERGEITTKWLVMGFPLLPIRSYLILYRPGETFTGVLEYEKPVMQPLPGYFRWRQMLRTALISYGTLAWCWGCLWLMFISPCV